METVAPCVGAAAAEPATTAAIAENATAARRMRFLLAMISPSVEVNPSFDLIRAPGIGAVTEACCGFSTFSKYEGRPEGRPSFPSGVAAQFVAAAGCRAGSGFDAA